MNKNIIIGFAVVAIIIVVGAFFVLRGQETFDVSLFLADETELANLGNDIDNFFKDDALAGEFDETFGDILDERAAIGADDALNDALIAKEANQADFTQTLNDFAADDAALPELDQSIGEVSL